MRVVVLRLDADPEHTPAWQLEERKKYSNKDWRREMEGDWSSPAGDPYFPIFSEVGREAYVHQAKRLIKGPVFRSYDTGGRRPAAVWFQYSPRDHRIWILREYMPHDQLTHEFRDAVRYLSNQLEWSRVPYRAQQWVDAYAAKASGLMTPPPWFPLGTRFVDIAGKEMVQRNAQAVRPEEQTFADVFREGGIDIVQAPNLRILGRNQMVGHMLMLGTDGWPRTFIDPQAEEIIEGFEGAFTYPQPTEKVPIPTEPKDDGHYINLLDALGYGVSAVVPADTPKPKREPVIVGYGLDGRTPIYDDPGQEAFR